MTEKKKEPVNIELNLRQILEYGGGSMHFMFLKQSEEYAKRAFKAIKGGERIPLGQMTVKPKTSTLQKDGEMQFNFSLDFDYSEFRGPGFNFPTFKSALGAMLNNIATMIREKKDPNLLHNQENGGVLIHHPGFIQNGDQLNVMVLSIEPGKKTDIHFKLFFVDPEQYKRKDAAAG